jgi:SOS-response transcriptional repressor LexA
VTLAYATRPPTTRQGDVLRFIASSTAERGFPPTLREISDGVCIVSTNGVSDHLAALSRKGLVTVTPGVARGIVLTAKGKAWLEQSAEQRGDMSSSTNETTFRGIEPNGEEG